MIWKPQILTAMLALCLLGILVICFQPEYIDKVVGGVVTGIGMLGIKLLENGK